MWRTHKKIIDDTERVINDVDRSRERTMNRAVKLLAAKPRSVGELRERLLEKLWTNQEIVNTVIERLKEYKYLDDDQFARDLALSKLRQKPQGKRKLQQSLSRKKLELETLETALDAAYEKMSEQELIEIVIEKRIRLKGKPATRDETKKLYDFLVRQGFSFDSIKTKIAEYLKNPRFDDRSI